ncbi:hypothetical protein Taro_052163 [Colocasia esculenta]|uniref:Uncharacterized protein n=1 Tax=Colocasia esculenta TaxID=4460 RepID=A0A843XIW8_COLES|nr:hypothetical protein [Colocasia esculenta]
MVLFPSVVKEDLVGYLECCSLRLKEDQLGIQRLWDDHRALDDHGCQKSPTHAYLARAEVSILCTRRLPFSFPASINEQKSAQKEGKSGKSKAPLAVRGSGRSSGRKRRIDSRSHRRFFCPVDRTTAEGLLEGGEREGDAGILSGPCSDPCQFDLRVRGSDRLPLVPVGSMDF